MGDQHFIHVCPWPKVSLSSMFAAHPLLVLSTTAGRFMCTQIELTSLCLLQNNKGLCPQILGYLFADEAGFGDCSEDGESALLRLCTVCVTTNNAN
jgi:hypothetical protein